MIFDRLVQFRQHRYELIGRSQDSVFDLMDSMLTSPVVALFVHVSQHP